MLFRLEVEPADCISIKHVESGREIGFAFEGQAVHPGGRVVDHCTLYSTASRRPQSFPETGPVHPLTCALIAAVTRQAHYKYPNLVATTPDATGDRVERRLGTLIADTASAFSRGVSEASGSGLTAETRDKFAASLAALASVRWASRFGCFDTSSRTEEPYFANPSPSGPRLTFSSAAQIYGMRELGARHPDLTGAACQQLLGWVLQWLSDVLTNELEEQKKETAAATQAWKQRAASFASRPDEKAPNGPVARTK